MNEITENLWMNEITENLWITDIKAIAENDTSDFDLVLSVCQDKREDNVDSRYFQVEMADGPISEKGWGGSCSYGTFHRAALIVALTVHAQEKTLVHCHSGQNRSAAVCAAALGVEQNLSYAEAIEKVREARPIANPTEQMEEHARRFING